MNDLSSQPARVSSAIHKPRLAILVDGDNVPHSARAEIEAKADMIGTSVIRRVYADMALHKDWASDTDFLAIHCTSSAGKNRADIHLVIGALDIAHRGLATHFLILSDDRDFGPLVAHLREIGMQVDWTGKPKPTAKPISASSVATKAKALGGVDQRLLALLQSTKGGLGLQALGSQMKNGTVAAQTGKPTWRAYIKSKDDLYTLTGAGSASIVTLKSR